MCTVLHGVSHTKKEVDPQFLNVQESMPVITHQRPSQQFALDTNKHQSEDELSFFSASLQRFSTQTWDFGEAGEEAWKLILLTEHLSVHSLIYNTVHQTQGQSVPDLTEPLCCEERLSWGGSA